MFKFFRKGHKINNVKNLVVEDKNLTPKSFKVLNKKILLINHTNFLKNDAGNNAYLFNIVKILKKLGYSIDFLSSEKFVPDDYKNFDELNEKYKFIDNFYLVSFNKKNRKYPYSNLSGVDDDFIDLFQKVIKENQYSYIISICIFFSDLFRFSTIPSSTKVVNIFHDFHTMQMFFYDKNFDCLGRNFEEEVKLLQYYDRVLCISYDEKFLFEKFYPNKKFYWLPFFSESKFEISQKKDIDLLFIGYSNIYNYNSIIWFYENVLPLLDKKTKLYIVGKVGGMIRENDNVLYNKMLEDNVVFIDYAEDLDELYAKTKIAIVPMFGGTGMKVKTVSAMSYGTPIVGTLAAVDGFADKFENGCLISDTPAVFADNIKKLLDDEDFYKKVSLKEQEYFKNHFSETNAENILKEVLDD